MLDSKWQQFLETALERLSYSALTYGSNSLPPECLALQLHTLIVDRACARPGLSFMWFYLMEGVGVGVGVGTGLAVVVVVLGWS